MRDLSCNIMCYCHLSVILDLCQPTISLKVPMELEAPTVTMENHPITHIHPFNGPFPGLPRWAGTRKVKPIWILLKQDTVSGSGISWAICKSALRCRQITTPSPHHSVFYRPDALPAAQPTVSKHWRLLILLMLHELTFVVESALRNPIHCI